MAPQLRLLLANGLDPLTSVNLGNILAGADGAPQLFFADSHGDAICSGVEFGVEAIAGNDGYSYAQIAEGVEILPADITVQGAVTETGGSIAAGADIAYKITVVDQWGRESNPTPSALEPAFATGNTNRVTLSWNALPGAVLYRVYSSVAGGPFFRIGETASLEFSDLEGTNNGIDSPPTAGKAYRAAIENWSPGPIQLGDLAPGDKKPVLLRQVIPAGSTSAGNPRRHRIYVGFLTI